MPLIRILCTAAMLGTLSSPASAGFLEDLQESLGLVRQQASENAKKDEAPAEKSPDAPADLPTVIDVERPEAATAGRNTNDKAQKGGTGVKGGLQQGSSKD